MPLAGLSVRVRLLTGSRERAHSFFSLGDPRRAFGSHRPGLEPPLPNNALSRQRPTGLIEMKKEIVELPVDQLRLGIYVSRLDRPWADTPFLFQGFAVKSDEELQMLRRLCKVVYAEVSVEE